MQCAEALAGSWNGQEPGYWDGPQDFGYGQPYDKLRRLRSLDPSVMLTVLGAEAIAMFSVSGDGPTGPDVIVQAEGQEIARLAPPDADMVVSQLPFLRMGAKLRDDRMAEILSQQGDILSFFGAQQRLDVNARKWTIVLIQAFHSALAAHEYRVKYMCSVPRPVDLSPRVQPIIPTPGHSAYPSGHATESFAIATVLAALRHFAVKDPADPQRFASVLRDQLAVPYSEQGTNLDPLTQESAVAVQQLYRLASRIAENRTVAGVHYPVDSAHGAATGLMMALSFVCYCSDEMYHGDHVQLVGNDWGQFAVGGNAAGDFTLGIWRDWLVNGWAVGAGAGTNPGGGQSWDQLRAVWAGAVEEWKNTA
ncbi:phosphatase PAP2 family protein [Paracoccus sp. M683]|uniref:phosphatase PAP2 family protein n=1 Tax=Paracoccus sp. M683 TaxID=2594268 RepID=UPI002103857F|nr:phosphatase PAP2 family protein [Paracoccus sp. M683]